MVRLDLDIHAGVAVKGWYLFLFSFAILSPEKTEPSIRRAVLHCGCNMFVIHLRHMQRMPTKVLPIFSIVYMIMTSLLPPLLNLAIIGEKACIWQIIIIITNFGCCIADRFPCAFSRLRWWGLGTTSLWFQ